MSEKGWCGEMREKKDGEESGEEWDEDWIET